MKKKIELPLCEPMYATYHYQGASTSAIADNTSVRNWYLNEAIMLCCTVKFLNGFTSPQLTVKGTHWNDNPYFDREYYSLKFIKGYMNIIIKKMLNEGYYVCFQGIDDYYIEGKTFYRKRHFNHDGCICGYDDESKTYCIYAYDGNWVYRKFWVPQKNLEEGRRSAFKQNVFGGICAFKPKSDKVFFSSKAALEKIREYLNFTVEGYSESATGNVYGIAVHDFIAKYVEKLYDGSIPYERTDRRVFRLIWEHKKVMLERISSIEKELLPDSDIGARYKNTVSEANTLRMLYASHIMKRRDSALPLIRKKLLELKAQEDSLLRELLIKTRGDN